MGRLTNRDDAMATPLSDILATRIETEGPIPVADFMASCLDHPEHGYYRSAQPLGREGDFITAPEISQVFGELIGLWSASVWQLIGSPETLRLIELGPGRGTLAADALRAARAVPAFRDAIALHLVETSPVLRQAQQETLGGTAAAHWHDGLETVPDGPSIILANEFLDALPVRQIVWREEPGAWRERCVGFDRAAGFHFTDGDAAQIRPAERQSLPEAPSDGDLVELRPGIAPLMNDIARRGEPAPAAALFIDYGHRGEAVGDTLQAVADHRYANVLDEPGRQDLTAHVDFGGLARAARDRGLQPHGPMAQGHFLLGLGLEARCQTLMAAASADQQASLMSGVRRLVDPQRMGEIFKVMAITRGLTHVPPPFDASAVSETDT